MKTAIVLIAVGVAGFFVVRWYLHSKQRATTNKRTDAVPDMKDPPFIGMMHP